MGRSQLVELLRRCPFSNYFGDKRSYFDKEGFPDWKLRQIAIDMIKEQKWKQKGEILEHRFSQEEGSSQQSSSHGQAS